MNRDLIRWFWWYHNSVIIIIVPSRSFLFVLTNWALRVRAFGPLCFSYTSRLIKVGELIVLCILFPSWFSRLAIRVTACKADFFGLKPKLWVSDWDWITGWIAVLITVCRTWSFNVGILNVAYLLISVSNSYSLGWICFEILPKIFYFTLVSELKSYFIIIFFYFFFNFFYNFSIIIKAFGKFFTKSLFFDFP